MNESLDRIADFYPTTDTKIPSEFYVAIEIENTKYIVSLLKTGLKGLFILKCGLLVGKYTKPWKFKKTSDVKLVIATIPKIIESIIPFTSNLSGIAIDISNKNAKNLTKLAGRVFKKSYLRSKFDFLPVSNLDSSNQFLFLARKGKNPSLIFKNKMFKDYIFSQGTPIPSEDLSNILPLKKEKISKSVKKNKLIDFGETSFPIESTHINEIIGSVVDEPKIETSINILSSVKENHFNIKLDILNFPDGIQVAFAFRESIIPQNYKNVLSDKRVLYFNNTRDYIKQDILKISKENKEHWIITTFTTALNNTKANNSFSEKDLKFIKTYFSRLREILLNNDTQKLQPLSKNVAAANVAKLIKILSNEFDTEFKVKTNSSENIKGFATIDDLKLDLYHEFDNVDKDFFTQELKSILNEDLPPINLNSKEISFIKKYTGMEYVSYNNIGRDLATKFLEKSGKTELKNSNFLQMAKIFDKIDPTEKDLIVYRRGEILPESRVNLKDFIIDGGFVSTSIIPDFRAYGSGNIDFTIVIPKGSKVIWADPISINEGEGEIILPPFSVLKGLKKETEYNKFKMTFIYMGTIKNSVFDEVIEEK